jgi:selenide,water dikinase
VQTVDFFTPSSTTRHLRENCRGERLVDVYAMGGRPLTALAIAGFPKDADRSRWPTSSGRLQALENGRRAARRPYRPGQEIKFGYAVTGEVDPARVWTNAGAKPGTR